MVRGPLSDSTKTFETKKQLMTTIVLWIKHLMYLP